MLVSFSCLLPVFLVSSFILLEALKLRRADRSYRARPSRIRRAISAKTSTLEVKTMIAAQ